MQIEIDGINYTFNNGSCRKSENPNEIITYRDADAANFFSDETRVNFLNDIAKELKPAKIEVNTPISEKKGVFKIHLKYKDNLRYEFKNHLKKLPLLPKHVDKMKGDRVTINLFFSETDIQKAYPSQAKALITEEKTDSSVGGFANRILQKEKRKDTQNAEVNLTSDPRPLKRVQSFKQLIETAPSALPDQTQTNNTISMVSTCTTPTLHMSNPPTELQLKAKSFLERLEKEKNTNLHIL